MKRNILAATLFCAAGFSAAAQAPSDITPPARLIPSSAPAPADGTVPPKPAPGIECAVKFEPDPALTNIQGNVSIAISVAKDGTASNPAVAQSSGSARLDEIAKACMAKWKIEPARKSGEAVDYAMDVPLSWRLDPFDDTAQRLGIRLKVRFANCALEFYPADSVRAREEGTVGLAMIIGTDGVPRDVRVQTSSGKPRLDAAAVQCVRSFRYTPPMKDGVPIEVPGNPTVVWKLR